MPVDASSDEDVNAVIDAALTAYGRLDVFFANAGVAGIHPYLTQTKEAFLTMMSINAWRYVYKYNGKQKSVFDDHIVSLLLSSMPL